MGVATLFLFDVETGEILSRHLLLDRPSELALYESDSRVRVAVASAVANSLSVISIDEPGELNLLSMFSPSDGRFDETNNPAFSADGRTVYIASSEGDRLFAVDARSGSQFASLSVPAPQRVAVALPVEGEEMIGVTRIRRPANGRPGGVTLISSRSGRLEVKADFTPPEGVEFSTANNLAFDSSAPAAFIGSDTGILFAFNTGTGDLESHQQIGEGLHRIALTQKARKVAAVRSTPTGDEIIIIDFDLVQSDEPDSSGPKITSLKPDTVEQGRLKGLHLVVVGENLTEDDALLVNGGLEIAGDLTKQGRALSAKLQRSLFDQPGDVSIQVKGANGVLSQPALLRVRRPLDPVIDAIKPEEVPGPAPSFTLKVTGSGFRASSAISLGAEVLTTEVRSGTELRALVPAELASAVGKLTVQVKDLAVPDLLSNRRDLTVFGPRITALKPMVETIVAGDGGFKLKIEGQNFRNQAVVEINGNALSSTRVRRNGSNALKVNVPKRFIEDAGKLLFVVRNPEGSASEAKELDALAPAITSFEPGKVLAGLTDVKVGIRGTNFRKGARVYVANANTREAVKVERQRVRFRSSSHLVVTFNDEKLNAFIAQQGALKFQVVNPNSADGVASVDQELMVVGPEIREAAFKAVKGDDSRAKLQISGANFRKGAVVEFFKEDNVYDRQRVPDKVREDLITIELRSKKVEGLRNLDLRVVNPGNVRSAAVKARDDREGLLDGSRTAWRLPTPPRIP
jgi:hypothetical protein